MYNRLKTIFDFNGYYIMIKIKNYIQCYNTVMFYIYNIYYIIYLYYITYYFNTKAIVVDI